MTIFKSNGFSIRYESFKNQMSKNILFIHGNLASSEWWFPTIELMKSKDSDLDDKDNKRGTLLCADWRGYGQSKGLNTKGDINFKTFAQDYINLINHLELQDVTVVGHSAGGLIAMLAILNSPHLFKNLVLLDSVGLKGLELQFPKDQVLAHFAKMKTDPDYCKMVLSATIQDCDPHSNSFTQLYQITRQCDPIMWEGVIDVLSDSIDISSKVKDINLPTLIIHGEKDPVLPLSGSEELNRSITNSQLKVIPNHGHSLNMENPSLFVELLSQFVFAK